MSQGKSSIKTKAGCLPTQPVKNEKPFNPAFPGKKEPGKQAVIDAEQISLIDKTIDNTAKDLKDFKAFVKAVKDVEPYWMTYYQSNYPAFQELLKSLGHTTERFRKKYGSKIPAMPEDLFSIPDWIIGIEAAIKNLEASESNSRKKKEV